MSNHEVARYHDEGGDAPRRDMESGAGHSLVTPAESGTCLPVYAETSTTRHLNRSAKSSKQAGQIQ